MTTKKEKDKLIGLYFLLAVVILTWIISIYVIKNYYPELKDRALFGDSFGTINSLFSGLAFAGIIYTILLQRKELALQRDELRETRIELNRSAVAQEKSEIQQKRQSENLKITAKLNALNTLANYYTKVEETLNYTEGINTAKRRKEECIDRIIDILNRKENS